MAKKTEKRFSVSCVYQRMESTYELETILRVAILNARNKKEALGKACLEHFSDEKGALVLKVVIEV